MVNFFKELVDQSIIQYICEILSTASNPATVTPLHKICIHTISTMIAPIYGDTFSFPWKRNPHESINEYIEVVPILESMKLCVFKCLGAFDWVSKLTTIFNSEDVNTHIVTKVAVLRIFVSLLRLNSQEKELVAETLIGH
jgi:hypothetical protein